MSILLFSAKLLEMQTAQQGEEKQTNKQTKQNKTKTKKNIQYIIHTDFTLQTHFRI